MDAVDYLRFIASLALVIGLILAGLWAVRRFGLPGGMAAMASQRRLGLVETLSLDGKRRLVLVRRDDRLHLLLIGGGNDLVIEQGIAPAPNGGESGP